MDDRYNYKAPLFIRDKKKAILYLSIASNLTILSFFKYFNFFKSSLFDLSKLLGMPIKSSDLNIVLPVGISFYTFQSMSYTIDIFKKKMNADDSFFRFALYVAFFPQLVAGPIVRARDLLPQFKKRIFKLDWKSFFSGTQLVLWGLFKKMVIADNAAIVVKSVFGQPLDSNPLKILIATYLFAVQIYCDFSGYSDIAIGVARILGFKMDANFQRPYFASNIQDFWRRWHISLSCWLRDYLYIPLGGNRAGKLMTLRNIFITMFLGGLWHGANYTFLIWGSLHSAYLIAYKLIENISKRKLPKIIGIFFTFHLVCLSWIFFRASDLQKAKEMISIVFNFFSWLNIENINIYQNSPWLVMKLFLLIIFLFYVDLKDKFNSVNFCQRNWVLSAVIFTLILLFGRSNTTFVYFQF